MMFFCRGARLSAAAALDQAFKSSSSGLLLLQQVQVKGNGLGDVTWTLRNNNALKCSRAFCVTTGPIMGKREEDFVTVENWDSSLGYFGRAAATIALNRSRTQQSVSGGNTSRPPVFEGSSQSRRRHTVGTCGSVVVLTGGQVCSPRWLLTAMQTRASSTTAAAARKHETGAGETSTDNKGEEQSLKEPPFSARKPEQEEGKPNKTQQLKKVFKEYGAVGVGFHVTISLMSLGMFYLLVSSGVDMAAVLCKVGFSEAVVQSKMAAGTSTFVLAYAVHKLFAPVRMSVTLVSVPLIVRYFRTTGLFKPPTPAP